MTERSPAGGVQTTVTTEELEDVEEKVVRMRHGYPAPDHAPLPQRGEADEALRRQLREIELRALKESGRLDELREEVGLEPVEEAAAHGAAKKKIIAGLKKKPTGPDEG